MEKTTAFDGTQEGFELFKTELKELFPDAAVTLQSFPILGKPYIIVHMDAEDLNSWDSYVLIVDVGQSLNKDSKGDGQVVGDRL